MTGDPVTPSPEDSGQGTTELRDTTPCQAAWNDRPPLPGEALYQYVSRVRGNVDLVD